ncbi:ATP-dependent DNA helicase [Metallosphaera tengchongensis]|uniref:ATP-dependent DNA helicase n=1 Tax=Metallosphaera tengchongensis TaxID=1532350 RepID=A0A6N0NRX6_9CREN|nr:ATP-dependent DNA helicase [Metallosphaera tengchongensis]QKQ99461.1 ATP-dependent DNA helicase [Metallosphaera tengchongensis]
MELRDWQHSLKDKVVKALNEGQLVALQSPTGSGKTLFSLVSALEVRDKVLFAVRTLNEFYPIYREAVRLGKTFSFIVGKSKACLYTEEGVDPEDVKCSLCMTSSPGLVQARGPPFSVLRDLKERGKLDGFCPYFTLMEEMPKADVVALTYPYLFIPWMRESLGIDLESYVIVVDEAHNLDNLNEIEERRLTEQTIELAVRQAKNEATKEILFRLKEGLRKVVLDEEKYVLVKDFPRPTDEELKLLKEEYEERRREMILNKSIKRLHLGSVIKFYLGNEDPVFSYKGGLIRKPVTPTQYVSVLNENIPVIIMSGTMQPKDYLSKVLGISREILYIDVEKETKSRVTGTYDCVLALDVTSSYSSRGQEMWKKYASYLLRIYYSSPKNVLAIFPSYKIMEEVMKHVKVSKFVEGISTNLEEVTERVRGGKTIIAGVARGKLTEGVELTIDGRSVIGDVAICGIPYPSFDDYLRLRSEEIFKLTKQSLRDVLMEIPALVAVKQAIGRSIRSREDHATVWLLDKRFDTPWWKLKINCFNPKKTRL